MKIKTHQNKLSTKPSKGYKLLLPLSFLLLTTSLTTFVLGYKVIDIHGYIYSAAALIIPFRYLIGDIIAEIYGLSEAKKIIWLMILCSIIYSTVCVLTIKLPSPPYWSHQSDYDFVLGNTLKIAAYAAFGVTLGSMLNVFLLSKWKVLLKGKWFLFRSLGASITGELTQYIVVLTMMYWTVFGASKIIELIILDYSIQVILLLLLTPLAHMSIFFIKYIEGVDIYEKNVCFNPFNISSGADD